MTGRELGTTPAQMEFSLQIAKEVEVDGVGMGVLNDGTPYLTLRGLARMCGVEHTSVLRIASGWNDEPASPRVTKIRTVLAEQGFVSDLPYLQIKRDGVVHHAFPDVVCMAFLEYYAFEAKPPSDQAVDNYRLLARKTFRDYIYARVGFDPKAAAAKLFQQFQDRIDLNYESTQDGYFSIFKESAGLQVALMREGVPLSEAFIPDISMGMAWAKYWQAAELAEKYGERVPYDHYYPEYFPQAPSNPQNAHSYPVAALGEFKRWLREVYIKVNLPRYLNDKTKQGKMLPAVATAALNAVQIGLAPPKAARALPRR